MSDHALLSASNSHRWLHCTPCARLEETLPDTAGEDAAMGKLAHAVAELKLRKQFTEPMGPKKYAAALKKLQEESLYQPEMITCADTYMEYISGIIHGYKSPPHIALEVRVDYSHVAPEGFGTSDCIIIGGQDLHVVDYKYGQGVPVGADHNSQMMLYALGALAKYDLLYDIRQVHMAIVQPRLTTIEEWSCTVEELRAWGADIVPVAQQAFKGEGVFCAGDWCRFCRAKAQCRARAEHMLALDDFKCVEPPLISNEELGEILTRAQGLAAWLSDLQEYALSALLRGEEIPGYKAVEGRSPRQFADQLEAFNTLIRAGYDEAVLYERKPLTLAAVEKLLSKKVFTELLGGHVITPPGKPTLVPESDKRKPVERRTAADDFQPIPAA